MYAYSVYDCTYLAYNAFASNNKYKLREYFIPLMLLHMPFLLTREHIPQQKEKGNKLTSVGFIGLTLNIQTGGLME